MPETEQSPTAPPGCAPTNGSVRVVDRYISSDRRLTCEVVRVTATHIKTECCNGWDCWRNTLTLEYFKAREAVTLERGGEFVPSPNDPDQR